ncbi:MAG: rRNA maturation RNase YbeY [Patescibacteria group bacterium]
MIKTHLFVGSRYLINRKKMRQTVDRVLKAHKIENAQVDVSIVGKRKIQQLNEERLRHQGVTDVLSFPQHERNQLQDFPLPPGFLPHLGDIVICYPFAVETARRYGKLVDDRLCFYLEHGLMHLLGYHHD